ncbi:MAG: cobyrinate a,c-diamide synthase [Ardenticatenia bacterium]|nr:MAG: cobyrinate a,c-diamide synthase [Ardenticatenia bacterium]
MMTIPRLVVAGAHSGVGKTTLATGLMAALARRGLTVQPFKVGPDYIDPTYHTLATGRSSRNLDTWMVSSERVAALFARAAHNADIAVIEGVMGLFDGYGYESDRGSTAEVARLLRAPVVLVLDVARVARSAAAVAHGFATFAPDVPLAGFILNRVGSAAHGDGVRRAVEQATGLPVLGVVPREASAQVPSRHLGLVPTVEPGAWAAFVHAAADLVERTCDVAALLALAHAAPPLRVDASLPPPRPCAFRRIGVARDEAFSFYYEDNLDVWRDAGVEIVPFSPLRDRALPSDVDALYIGGGFPELYAEALADNAALRADVRAAHAADVPLYAECGGFMYLMQAILTQEGRAFPMVGLVPGNAVMQARRERLGYVEVEPARPHWVARDGVRLRGHVFHWSRWEGFTPSRETAAWVVLPRRGGAVLPEGYRRGRLVASYVHVHWAGEWWGA